MKKAMVAGHICLDITPAFPEGTDRLADPAQLLKPGKLIQVKSPDVHTGGAVANTGLAMKKLGADVRLVGKVGNDTFGGLVKRILNEHDAGADLIMDENCSTSYSIVLAIPGTDRIFLHDPGANDTFTGKEISDDALQDIDLFHFGYPTLMKCMYEDGGNHLSGMFQHIKEKDIVTSLDMAAIDPKSKAGAVDWKTVLQKVLPFVDFFVPSFEELCFMLDRQRLNELSAKAGKGDITDVLDIDTDVRPLSRVCHEMGAKVVVIKCGAPGLFISAAPEVGELCRKLFLHEDRWKGFSHFQQSFSVPQVVSATGAGDVSIAALLTSVLSGSDPMTAVENACACGALCCMSYDAISNLKPIQEVRRLIDKGWKGDMIHAG